jgi:hypothetical protein
MRRIMIILLLLAATTAPIDADAGPAVKKKKGVSKKTKELMEKSQRAEEEARRAKLTAEEAKAEAEAAKRQAEEAKLNAMTAEERRKHEEQKRIEAEAAQKAAQETAAAEAQKAQEQADAAKAEAEKARQKEEEAKQANDAAQKSEQEKRALEDKTRAEAEARRYVTGFYLRASGGAELLDGSAIGFTQGRVFAPAFGAGFGYRLGLLRLGAEYQGAVTVGTAGGNHWHKMLFNVELVFGGRIAEFFVRGAAGYALAVSTQVAHGGAAKAGIGLDFRIIREVAIGLGADFDVMMVFVPGPVFPIGGSAYIRFSFLF